MNLFGKRKNKDRKPAIWLDNLTAAIDHRQRKFADQLGRRTQYWSKLSWIIALAIFTLLFGGACLFLSIKAFIHFK